MSQQWRKTKSRVPGNARLVYSINSTYQANNCGADWGPVLLKVGAYIEE